MQAVQCAIGIAISYVFTFRQSLLNKIDTCLILLYHLAGFLADKFNGFMWSFAVAGILMQCAGILPVALVWLKKDEGDRTAERQCIEPEQV